MPRNRALPQADPTQHLADSIAAKKAQLRRMEARLRATHQRDRQAQYVRAGKIVESCGLLDASSEVLQAVLRAGGECVERHVQCAPATPALQEDATTNTQEPRP